MANRRPRMSLVVYSGGGAVSEGVARRLTEALDELGIETMFCGRLESPQRIAAIAAEERADAVEVCLSGGGGVSLLRELLRELIEVGRRDVSIVVHRVEKLMGRPPT